MSKTKIQRKKKQYINTMLIIYTQNPQDITLKHSLWRVISYPLPPDENSTLLDWTENGTTNTMYEHILKVYNMYL